MPTGNSSRPSDRPNEGTQGERKPLTGALRRLGLLSGTNGHDTGPAAQPDSTAERHDLRFMQSYLRQGDAVLDVGANIGTYALAAARQVGPAGRVDALEPSPTIRARLVENIARTQLKSVIVVHTLMAGVTPGLGRFVDGTSKSGRRRPPMAGELATRVIGLECVRLEQFIGKRRYALMHLDIAGGEMNALRGAEARLAEANPPALLVALDSALADFGTTPEIVADWLDDRGYEIALFDADKNLIEYPDIPWRRRRKVLAMARSARNFVLQRLANPASA
jgi:FkbM family methyltransferase